MEDCRIGRVGRIQRIGGIWRKASILIRIFEGPGGLLGSFFAIFEAWSGTFGFLGGFCRIPGASWRALTTFLRVCQEDLGAWGQLSDDPWEYLGMILPVWAMKMAVILRQEGTKERFDSKLWGWQNIEKNLGFS